MKCGRPSSFRNLNFPVHELTTEKRPWNATSKLQRFPYTRVQHDWKMLLTISSNKSMYSTCIYFASTQDGLSNVVKLPKGDDYTTFSNSPAYTNPTFNTLSPPRLCKVPSPPTPAIEGDISETSSSIEVPNVECAWAGNSMCPE